MTAPATRRAWRPLEVACPIRDARPGELCRTPPPPARPPTGDFHVIRTMIADGLGTRENDA